MLKLMYGLSLFVISYISFTSVPFTNIGVNLLQPVGYSTRADGDLLPVHVRPLQSGDDGALGPPLQLPYFARSWSELLPPSTSVGMHVLGTQPYRARDEATTILAQPAQQVPNTNVPLLKLIESGGGPAVVADKLPNEGQLLTRVPGARTTGVAQDPLYSKESPVPLTW